MPDPNTFMAAESVAISVAVAPAINGFNSLMLLNKVEHLSGLGAWVGETLAAMAPARRFDHNVVMIGLHYAVAPRQGAPDFPAYLDALSAEPPERMRRRLFDRYFTFAVEYDKLAAEALPTPEALLADRDAYFAFLTAVFGEEFDREVEGAAYDLMRRPAEMQRFLVEHLRGMWNDFLAAEWARALPHVEESAAAFRQANVSGMSVAEAAAFTIGQEPSEEFLKWAEAFRRVVFVPSTHVGPYHTKVAGEDTLWVNFRARLPEGVQRPASPLSRADLVVRLGALADDTRLRILALLAEHGELCARDIIAHLDLSQSAASRHLKQLSATGYVIERRQENAKCYRLNDDRLEATLGAIKDFLS